jgi:hypothetical protein
MNTELELLLAGNNRSDAGEQSSSLLDKVEAEKRAKIEELLAPYRAKRTELQTKRDEFATALVGLDKDLAELDTVITQIEASVGLQPSGKKKKKSAHGNGHGHGHGHARAKSAGPAKPAVTEDWVTQKLREYPKTQSELATLAKDEGFKATSVKSVANKLRDANVLRLNEQDKYEVV